MLLTLISALVTLIGLASLASFLVSYLCSRLFRSKDTEKP